MIVTSQLKSYQHGTKVKMITNGTSLEAKTTSILNTTFSLNSTLVVPTYLQQEEFLALQISNSSVEANFTFNDTIVTLKNGSWYPSGYSPLHIICASVVVTALMIMVVVGNMLVIIAIVTEKSLKNIQNWFIASLAVSDFFLGLIIMPFSLANELMGYWIFGFWWCEIHSAMDVLLCTASIMNLCLISLDRYWSITQAVEYLKKRTPARAALMIAAVWIMSALVCIPPLLGWRVSRPEQQFPECKVSDDIGYVMYSSLGSFYIPSCIMVFVYIRIYFAAKARARRGIRKNPRPRPNEQQTSFSNPPKGTRPMPSSSLPMPPGVDSANSNNNRESQISTIEQKVTIPTVTCDFASDVSTSEAGDMPHLEERKDTLKVMTPGQVTKNPLSSCPLRASSLSINGELQKERGRAPSMAIDTDMVSELEPSSSDSGVVSRCGGVKPLKLRIFKKSDSSKKHQKSQPKQSELEPALPKPHKPRDPEREKKRLARKKEKRATLILGLIMGSFIACWLPFFFLYILKAACRFCVIPGSAFAIAFWLGYMNSVLNPVIYTIFNKDFRRAFRRILFK